MTDGSSIFYIPAPVMSATFAMFDIEVLILVFDWGGYVL